MRLRARAQILARALLEADWTRAALIARIETLSEKYGQWMPLFVDAMLEELKRAPREDELVALLMAAALPEDDEDDEDEDEVDHDEEVEQLDGKPEAVEPASNENLALWTLATIRRWPLSPPEMRE